MALKELFPASFRGVAFEVESAELSGGRRVQVHEYPQRDKEYREDNGRKARDEGITGFIVGPDYINASKKFIDALEAYGPGTLVHPWFGTYQIQVETFRVSYSHEEGGVARFTISHGPAGQLTYPNATTDTAAKARIGADAAMSASLDQFNKAFKVADQPDFVGASAKAESVSIISRATAGLKGITGSITGAANQVTGGLDALLLEPRNLGQALQSLFGTADTITNFPERATASVKGLLSLYKTPDWLSLSRPSLGSVTPSRLQQVDNTNALRTLMRQSSLIDAVGAATVMPALVFDDVIGIRKALFDALDAEALIANDDTFSALTDLRVQMAQDLSERARDAARLYSLTPREVLPAVVLAYDLYEDPERAEEIIARNKIRHPGFVPVLPLQVLSR